MNSLRSRGYILEIAHWITWAIIVLVLLQRENRPPLAPWVIVLAIIFLLGFALRLILWRERGGGSLRYSSTILLVDAILASLLVYFSGGISSLLYPTLILCVLVGVLGTDWAWSLTFISLVCAAYVAAVLFHRSSSPTYDLVVRTGGIYLCGLLVTYVSAPKLGAAAEDDRVSEGMGRKRIFEGILVRDETILKSLDSSLVVTDPSGGVTLFNQAASDLLGISGEVEGARIQEILGERIEGFDFFWVRVNRELVEGCDDGNEQRWGISQELRITSGEERVLLVKASPIKSSLEGLSGFVFIFDDVTERVKLDEIRDELMLMLARRVEEFAALHEMGDSLTNIPHTQKMLDRFISRAVELLGGRAGAIALLDPGGGSFVYKTIYGMKEGLLGKSFQKGEGLPGKVAQFGEGMLVERVDPHGAALYCLAVPSKVSVLMAPIIWQERVKGVFEIFGDAEEREFSEDDLRLLGIFSAQASIAMENANLYQTMSEDKQRMESILLAIADAVVAINGEARIILVNSMAEKVLNLPPLQEVHGKHIKEVIRHPDIANLLLKSLNTREELASEVILHYPQNLVLEVETSVILDEAGEKRGVVAVIRDITRLRQLEQAKSDFVSTVSHELRTPLTSIKAYTATLLREDVHFNEETKKEFLRVIEEETDRLTRLISDLLDVSRIDSGKLELKTREFDFVKLVKIVVEKIQSQADKHNINLVAPEYPVSVDADADKIEQVMLNLLGNAVKYSPSGGEVEVRIKEYSHKVECAIQDQGVGIPKEHLTKIFEKFQRVDNRATRGIGGTGLGLYISKSIVEAHGGTIWAESAPGKGSVFHFTLPLASSAKKTHLEETENQAGQ